MADAGKENETSEEILGERPAQLRRDDPVGLAGDCRCRRRRGWSDELAAPRRVRRRGSVGARPIIACIPSVARLQEDRLPGPTALPATAASVVALDSNAAASSM
jgi:hypothetical protein